jgi:ribokinase
VTPTQTSPPRLVCLGNLTLDDTVLPDGTERLACAGGDALYAALGARLWEPAVQLVAPRGDDLPLPVAARIEAEGFSLEGLPNRLRPTIHNRVEYDNRGGRRWTLYSSPDDFDALSPRPADIPGAFLEAEAFLIAAMSLEAQEELGVWLRRRTRAAVALDLQEDYIAGNQQRLRALIGQAHLFLPSEDEVRQLFGHDEWERAAREAAALGPEVVVIKRGARGSLVHDKSSGRTIEVTACPAAVVDTTGAGDAYCGGFLAQFIHSPRDLLRCARAGAVSSSFAVEGFGTDALLRVRAETAAARLADWEAR